MKLATKIHRLSGVLTVLSLVAGGVAIAQDDEQKPDRMLRLLPLGEPPPWEEVNDGVRRVQQDPPPGSVPPLEVVQLDEGGIEKGDTVRLRLNQPTSGLPVGPAVALYDAEEVGGGPGQPWVKFAMPRGKSHALAVLWRNRGEKWTDAKSLVLPEDLTSFPPGAIRFVNVTPWNAEFSVAGQTVRLEAGKFATSRPRAAFKKQPLKVYVVAGGGAREKIADQEINQGANQRTTFFVYAADGVKPRIPAKLKLLLENARNLPELPKR